MPPVGNFRNCFRESKLIMMNSRLAKRFAEEWINSWNNQDLGQILDHYADDLEFHSPFILLLNFNKTGVITNKEDLKRYFLIGLNSYPDLHFQFHNYFVGIETFVVHYTSINGRMAAELFQLNRNGKAIKVHCNYSDPDEK